MCKVNFRENSPVFGLAASGSFRGTSAIAGAPLLSFNFENCWPARLAGRIGLQAAVHKKTIPTVKMGKQT